MSEGATLRHVILDKKNAWFFTQHVQMSMVYPKGFSERLDTVDQKTRDGWLSDQIVSHFKHIVEFHDERHGPQVWDTKGVWVPAKIFVGSSEVVEVNR